MKNKSIACILLCSFILGGAALPATAQAPITAPVGSARVMPVLAASWQWTLFKWGLRTAYSYLWKPKTAWSI